MVIITSLSKMQLAQQQLLKYGRNCTDEGHASVTWWTNKYIMM